MLGGRRGTGDPSARHEVSVRCPLCDADHYRVRYDSTLTEAIDPQRICNPGKVLPTPRLCGEVPGPYREHPVERAGLAERF